jgi:hypothetical protein
MSRRPETRNAGVDMHPPPEEDAVHAGFSFWGFFVRGALVLVRKPHKTGRYPHKLTRICPLTTLWLVGCARFA